MYSLHLLCLAFTLLGVVTHASAATAVAVLSNGMCILMASNGLLMASASHASALRCCCISLLSRMNLHRRSRQSVITLQVPSQERDKEIVNAAKNIMFSSAQKLQLTELSGRRDMSLLLAQSAVQVSVMHIHLASIHLASIHLALTHLASIHLASIHLDTIHALCVQSGCV